MKITAAERMQLWHKHHPRHQRRARAEGEFAREVHGKSAMEQPAGKSAADQTTEARSRVRNPANAGRRVEFDLKRFHQKFRQPENVEIPRAVT